MNGVIPVDKPIGVTSRKVVDVVARALGTRAVGHAGTLDPLASGVVVACVGQATKLVDFIHTLSKHYSVTFLLGRSSPSDDFETEIEIEETPVVPDRTAVEAALGFFRGEILQRPCDYSAAHVDGKRAYRLARKGRPVALEPKRVRIDRLEITAYEWPRLACDVDCSSGTFIRAIGRDLAEALGTKAVMESLVRTAVGPFLLEQSIRLDAITPDSARTAILPAVAAVPFLPRFMLVGPTLDRAVRGGLLDLPESCADSIAAVADDGSLVGVLRRHESGRYRLRPNFRGAG